MCGMVCLGRRYMTREQSGLERTDCFEMSCRVVWVLSLLLCICVASLSGCLIGRNVDYLVPLVIRGSVCDERTGMPLDGALVMLKSDTVAGRDDGRALLGTTTERGISAEYECKWGRWQGVFAWWLSPGPKDTFCVEVSKPGYRSAELRFRIDKLPGSGQRKCVELGTVMLEEIGE